MPPPDLTAELTAIGRTRDLLARHEQSMEELRLDRSALVDSRARLLETGALIKAAALTRRIAAAQTELDRSRARRGDLLGEITNLSDGLLTAFSPEVLTATLDGTHPVAMLPVRIETRFETATRLKVRVFPDQVHIDAHDPALTADELDGARWYWQQRWNAGLDDAEAARAGWQGLTKSFRPGRAAYLVKATTPTNTPADGDPDFPTLPSRESTWSKPPLATALPDRFCVVGLAKANGEWVEKFREWGKAVPDRLAVGFTPRELEQAPQEGGLPVDEGTRWLREPAQAEAQGTLIEIEHPSLAQGVERLVVLGVDWTQLPDQAAASLSTLLAAQRYSAHLGFVPQGAPTNNTSDTRSTYSSDASVEAAALDPSAVAEPGDQWSAGTRLASALGLDPSMFDGVPGARTREHAWAAALTDVLWRGTAGYYITDLLDPLANRPGDGDDDPQVDANLREFARTSLFAGGPLPTLRVGAQPYGVLPVISARSYEPGAGQAEELVHRVASLMRTIVTPAIADIPHLRRAGEEQDVDTVLLTLLQRTPVPWTFRFRPVTGPVQRLYLSKRWDLINAFQRSWTSAMWVGLDVWTNVRLGELTHGKDHPLPVPLVHKPGDDNPTGYLGEIADLMKDTNGRKALNLREDSIALLEAMAAHSGVLELDRCALHATRKGLALSAVQLATLPALRSLTITTPDTVRVEQSPTVPIAALDFRSGRQLAEAVVTQVSSKPLGEFVTTELADRMNDLSALLGAPTDPFYWLGHHQVALQELAAAPPDGLEWAFRGYLDLFSTRLDAWFTALSTNRLAKHRQVAPTGVHLGCWGFVENLHRDTGPGAESLGFVHTPSLAHAASTALLRNGRLANRGDDGAVFDLQVTSERVRRATWLLEGVARGQRLAALLGYRLERGLHEAGLELMRYQMPMRRTAPLRGPDVAPEESVEVLAVRDVVDGVALLDRWRTDSTGVLTAIAKQAQLASLPAGDATKLRAVIDTVYDSYDAVSDLLVAESVHQAALGSLDRSGAALSAHDRHGAVTELDYISSPRSGHTIGHRVAIAMQDQSLATGWKRDARGTAEPLLDSWLSTLFGAPSGWQFRAVMQAADGTTTVLDPITLADLGLGPLSVALATQKAGAGRPSELEQRIGLAFAAQAVADPTAQLELLAEAEQGSGTGGLALLSTLGGWAAKVAAASPLSAADFVSGANLSGGLATPGTLDVDELAARVTATRASLDAVVAALGSATTPKQRSKALLDAVAFDGPDAMPVVPQNHLQAAEELAAQAAEVLARLTLLAAAVTTAVAETLPEGDQQVAARHIAVLKSLLGSAQPVLPRLTLTDTAPVAASLADRAALLGGDDTAPAAWLHRCALVRPELEAFAGLMLHSEAAGLDVSSQLGIAQLPHRPGAGWLALPFGSAGTPPHGSLGLVVHAWQPLNPSKAFAGLVVDGWTETIPAQTETTAVTFHYDAPGARAPQTVLLAVHPAVTPRKWSFDLLLETVNEAADLAQLRMLSSAELAPMGSFLPALYLPDDYTRDVPSVSLRELLASAEANGIMAMHADVLGKA